VTSNTQRLFQAPSDAFSAARPFCARHGNDQALPHLGRDAVKFGPPDDLCQKCAGGHSLSAKTGDRLMNAIRSEKIEQLEPEVEGEYAAASEVEAGIREFVRNDIAYLRRPAVMNTPESLEPGAEAAVNNVNTLIQRVAGTSLSEIENLISELESLRDLLHAEGQRVQREISDYAQLSQAAIKSTRIIAENVAQWKRTAEGLRNG
jgi:hypothetical protein